ncbi:MAG: ankyrin repeat domain-containing protein [Bacillota bacterium]|nr:ankyrin repeat domain-containing protein [Bacillota bacterium]MDW7682645.1 ankyrin repeat domain-containing protein [Bacillota bacterium]
MLQRKVLVSLILMFTILTRVGVAADDADIFTALYNNKIDRAMELVHGTYDVNEIGYTGDSMLHLAVNNNGALGGYEEFIKLLLEKGADVNIRNSSGETPLHYAAAYSPALIQLLISNGAEVNAESMNGATPLHEVLYRAGSKDTLRVLIANGAKVNTKTVNGTTPLMTAALSGNVQAIEVLIQAGADVYAADELKYTALHYAVESLNIASVKALIEAGADVNAKTYEGLTPLSLLKKNADPKGYKQEIVQLLAASGGKDSTFNALLRQSALPAAIALLLYAGWFILVIKTASLKRVIFSAGIITLVSGLIIGLVGFIIWEARTGQNIVLLLNVALMAIAVGGAAATRLVNAKWPEPVLAFLPIVLTLSVYQVFQVFRYQNPFYNVYYFDMLRYGAGYTFVGVSGLYLLPLFDPAVRKSGPNPNLPKVFATSLGLFFILIGFSLVRQMAGTLDLYYFGLGIFVLGGLTAILLVGLGLLLTLFRGVLKGAWFGCMGVVIWVFTSFVWIITGTPWFP